MLGLNIKSYTRVCSSREEQVAILRPNVMSVLTPELRRELCEVAVQIFGEQLEHVAPAVGAHEGAWDHAHFSTLQDTDGLIKES